MTSPTITAAVTVYNAEAYINESLTAILSQSRPPDEVVVVDDGSTDATPDELRRFGADIRVVRQANQGHSAAENRAFAEARCEYVAKCDSDDIWQPEKLERQFDAIVNHPEVDILFSAAWFFGLTEGPYNADPGEGPLDSRLFARKLYRENLICDSSTVVRRQLHEQLDPLIEHFPAEDYDYWLRALKHGAKFFYDPRVLVHYRRHDQQVTHNRLRTEQATYAVHGWHDDLAELADCPRFVREVKSDDLLRIGRFLVDADRPREARQAFVSSLHERLTPRGLAWAFLLSSPRQYRRALTEAVVAGKRAGGFAGAKRAKA